MKIDSTIVLLKVTTANYLYRFCASFHRAAWNADAV